MGRACGNFETDRQRHRHRQTHTYTWLSDHLSLPQAHKSGTILCIYNIVELAALFEAPRKDRGASQGPRCLARIEVLRKHLSLGRTEVPRKDRGASEGPRCLGRTEVPRKDRGASEGPRCLARTEVPRKDRGASQGPRCLASTSPSLTAHKSGTTLYIFQILNFFILNFCVVYKYLVCLRKTQHKYLYYVQAH